MTNTTRAARDVQARAPGWRRVVRRTFPLPRRTAWLLAAGLLGGVVLVDTLLGVVLRSGS